MHVINRSNAPGLFDMLDAPGLDMQKAFFIPQHKTLVDSQGTSIFVEEYAKHPRLSSPQKQVLDSLKKLAEQIQGGY